MCNSIKKMKLFAEVLVFTALLSLVAGKCNPREYSKGSIVCVCSEKLKCEGDFAILKINSNPKTVTSYRTTKSGERFEHREYAFTGEEIKLSNNSATVVNVEIDSAKKYQKIMGFGGAFTDATGYNIVKLPKSLQTRLIRDYFAPEGIGYRMGRIPIGGTDFSTRAYSYDDNPDDETLSKFSLQAEDFAYKLPFLKMAQELTNNTMSYFGSTWASPAWMKTNKQLNHGGLLIGEPGGKYFKLFAKYLVKFFQEYQKQGVDVWGLTVVNEPHFGFDPIYLFNVLGFSKETQRDFVKLDLGPEFEQAGLKDKKIMIFDDNLSNFTEFANTVLSDKDANKYVAGAAFHWYENYMLPVGEILDGFKQRYPDKFLLSTEACFVVRPLGDWTTFEFYAKDIIVDLNHNTNGWIDWNMVLDLNFGPNWVNNFMNAAIVVNATGAEYFKQPTFYAMGHFAKFLLPDSVRIHHEVKNADQDILITVFERPDKSKVLTVINKRTVPIQLHLHDPANGHVTVEIKESSLESLIWH